jgi:hypothetical protein
MKPINMRNSLDLTEFRVHHISSCLATLTYIQRKLDKFLPESGQQPIKQALKSLKWPFSTSEITELLAEVEKHKANINLALSGNTLSVVLKALSRQEDVAIGLEKIAKSQNERWEIQNRIRLDQKRQQVLDFFGRIDPSSNHRMSLKL